MRNISKEDKHLMWSSQKTYIQKTDEQFTIYIKSTRQNSLIQFTQRKLLFFRRIFRISIQF